MPKQIIIAEQHRIAAVFSEDQIQELIVAKGNHQVSDIYLGVVENVLPGIDAAFVNIGDSERNGFIHVSDLGPLRLRKAAGSITELLAPQQKVLVQVMKEPTGNKGPRLTGNITLPGRYLVLMPFGRGVNLSRRIRNESERNRLRALGILIKPAGMGLLIRTEAEGMDEKAILEDLDNLQNQWENIQQEALSTRPPSLLNRDDDFIQRVLRDVYSADVNRIVVDSHTGMKRVKQHLMNWSSGKPPQGVLVDHHRDRIPILEFFRVNAAIREALKPRVDLPSGGYIIIERTEALTVIDVNSGSFTRSATARETVLWTNCEAATEIARQLRLRNIAGVIIVDFIDMDSRRDQLQVLEQFNKTLKADKARPQIAQLSELGLVELTRKRQGQNIYELFGRPCSHCGGLGHLVHLPGEPDHEEAEPAEPLRSVPIVEPRTPQLRDSWERPAPATDEFEFDASSDLQELDLVNHPSYQERGRGDNRRRRRSRLKLGEPSAKGLPLKAADSEPELEPAPVEEPAAPTRAAKEGRENRDTRDGREKVERNRSGRRDKPPVDPPQLVSVEMTPEEQDVYALMGISPLVLAAEPVKDPKSTIVSVSLPGQSIRSGNGNHAGVGAVFEPTGPEPAGAEPGDTARPVIEPPVTRQSRRLKVDKAEELPDPVDLLPSNLPEPQPELEPELEPESDHDGTVAGEPFADALDNGMGESTRRRRRRRSSVTMTESPSDSDVG
jgi:ribonuclease E